MAYLFQDHSSWVYLTFFCLAVPLYMLILLMLTHWNMSAMPAVSLGLMHSLCVMFVAVYGLAGVRDGWAGALCFAAAILLPFVIGFGVLFFLAASIPSKRVQYSFPGENSVSNADLQIPLLF